MLRLATALRKNLESSAPLPVTRSDATPAAGASRTETPLGPPSLPRQRHTPLAGGHSRAVTAVLLGVQGAGMLVGAPMIAHAQETPVPVAPADTGALAARLRDLQNSRDTMSPEALAEARRALWSSYVSGGAAEESQSYDFEKRWSEAADGSIDRAEAGRAITELGAASTSEKLLEMLEKYGPKLAESGRAELERVVAVRQLGAAAQDGKVTAEELAAIETSLGEKLGAERASAAMIGALSSSWNALDDGAAAHLLSRIASKETHVARFQMIVDELLDGKQKLVDADGDGKLNAGDLIFTEDAAGKISISVIEQKLADQAVVAKAMVDASYAMNGAGVSFALIKDHRANPDFWTVSPGGVLELKPGVKPSDAVADIVKNGSKYGFECATGLVAVYYQAMLDVLGPKDFDRVAADLKLGPWVMEDDLEELMVISSPKAGWTEQDLGEYQVRPGNYYYFKNWDVTPEAKARGWQGENVIYLGEGKYYGHGIGLGDAELFVGKLRSEAEPGGREPSLLNIEATLSTKLLQHDHTPGE